MTKPLLAEIHTTANVDITIRKVFSIAPLEVVVEEIERRTYQANTAMSEFQAAPLAEPNPVAGA